MITPRLEGFEIVQRRSGKWFCHIRYSNGEVIFEGAYNSRGEAVDRMNKTALVSVEAFDSYGRNT